MYIQNGIAAMQMLPVRNSCAGNRGAVQKLQNGQRKNAGCGQVQRQSYSQMWYMRLSICSRYLK